MSPAIPTHRSAKYLTRNKSCGERKDAVLELEHLRDLRRNILWSRRTHYERQSNHARRNHVTPPAFHRHVSPNGEDDTGCQAKLPAIRPASPPAIAVLRNNVLESDDIRSPDSRQKPRMSPDPHIPVPHPPKQNVPRPKLRLGNGACGLLGTARLKVGRWGRPCRR